MIKQDYLIRMIQDILSLLANALLKKQQLQQRDWDEYDHLTKRILGLTSDDLMKMNASMLIDRYADGPERFDKLELAALYLVKLAEEIKDESLVLRAKLFQEALHLLQYIQENGNSYSITRLQIIQMLKREGYSC